LLAVPNQGRLTGRPADLRFVPPELKQSSH